MVKIVFNSSGPLDLAPDVIEYYNFLRESFGLDLLYENIPRHDPHLVETVNVLDVASVIDINCTEYGIILDELGERVIPNPGPLLKKLLLELKNSYYANEECQNKLLSLINFASSITRVE